MARSNQSVAYPGPPEEVGWIMATQMNIKFNSDGFKQILCGDGVKQLVESTTDSIANNANANNLRGGEGFTADVRIGNYGGGRWVGFVSTTDMKSRLAESEDKALSRAVF